VHAAAGAVVVDCPRAELLLDYLWCCCCGCYHPQEELVPLVVVVVVVVRPVVVLVVVVVAVAEFRPMAVSPLQRKTLELATMLEKSRPSKFERVHVLQREGRAVVALLPRVVLPVVVVAVVVVVVAR
jgi:hypothetical protein